MLVFILLITQKILTKENEMADITGPISTLSGTLHIAHGDCDSHPGVPAVKRVQGETDSYGCEMMDMCQVCYDEFVAQHAKYSVEAATGRCDWCMALVVDLRQKRDFEEGGTGRIYKVCGDCNTKYNAEVNDQQSNEIKNRDWLDTDYA